MSIQGATFSKSSFTITVWTPWVQSQATTETVRVCGISCQALGAKPKSKAKPTTKAMKAPVAVDGSEDADDDDSDGDEGEEEEEEADQDVGTDAATVPYRGGVELTAADLKKHQHMSVKVTFFSFGPAYPWSILDRSRANAGLIQSRFGISRWPVQSRYGVKSSVHTGSVQDRSRIDPDSIRGRSIVGTGSIQFQSRIICGSVEYRSRINVGSVTDRSKTHPRS